MAYTNDGRTDFTGLVTEGGITDALVKLVDGKAYTRTFTLADDQTSLKWASKKKGPSGSKIMTAHITDVVAGETLSQGFHGWGSFTVCYDDVHNVRPCLCAHASIPHTPLPLLALWQPPPAHPFAHRDGSVPCARRT